MVRENRCAGRRPIKLLEADENAGTVRDVTEELIAEAAQPRDPRSWDDLAEQLRGALIDRQSNLKKYGVFGW